MAENDSERERKIAIVMASVMITFQIAVTGVMFYFMLRIPGVFESAARDHFVAVCGSPMAVMTAMVIVVLFRVTAGPIEFDTPLGFKFKGASGPVVLWVFTYLACVGGMVAMWNLHK